MPCSSFLLKGKTRIKSISKRGKMFSHRYSYWFAGILGSYSFLNIYLLDGDRLFAVDLEPVALFFLVLTLTFSVWALNRLIEKRIHGQVLHLHPLIFQFGISVVAVLVLSFISSQATGLVLSGPFSFTWQNFLLTTAFTSRINLFLHCINAIYLFNQRLHEKAFESEKLKTLTMEAKLESVNSQLNPHFFSIISARFQC